MSLSYGWQNLHRAINSLCGQGSQSERMVSAISALSRITPEEDLPQSIKSEFKDFYKRMTSIPGSGDEGAIQATVNTLDETKLNESVEKVIRFYDTTCRHREPN